MSGTGFIVGASRDGSALFVQDQSPQFVEPGCEGEPGPVLFRLTLADGKRELLATKAVPVWGQLLRGDDDKVAFAGGCEGYLAGLFTATESADGQLSNLVAIDLAEPSEIARRPVPNALEWAADGRSLVGADNVPREPEVKGTPLLSLDPATAKVSDFLTLDVTPGLTQLAQLADGTYVTANGNGTIEMFSAQGKRRATTAGNGFAVAADRGRVAVYGEAGLALWASGESSPTVLVKPEAGRQIDSADISPNGQAVVFTSYNSATSDSNDNRVAVVTTAEKQVVPVGQPGPAGRVMFTGDGRSIVYNRFRPAPDFTADVVVVTFSP